MLLQCRRCSWTTYKEMDMSIWGAIWTQGVWERISTTNTLQEMFSRRYSKTAVHHRLMRAPFHRSQLKKITRNNWSSRLRLVWLVARNLQYLANRYWNDLWTTISSSVNGFSIQRRAMRKVAEWWNSSGMWSLGRMLSSKFELLVLSEMVSRNMLI